MAEALMDWVKTPSQGFSGRDDSVGEETLAGFRSGNAEKNGILLELRKMTGLAMRNLEETGAARAAAEDAKKEAKAAKEEAAEANKKLDAANAKLDAAARERAELRELLEEVLAGGAELSLAAAVRLLQETRHLTPKEAEVWMLAQQGKKQGEIAEAAGIRQGTVSKMLARFENDPHLKRVKVRAVRQTRGGEVRG